MVLYVAFMSTTAVQMGESGYYSGHAILEPDELDLNLGSSAYLL